jgi:hypothetical protein
LLSYFEKSGQDEALLVAIFIIQQLLYKKNTVWQNAVYSINDPDIDLKIQYDMKPSMAHIFVTGKLFWKMPLYGCNIQFSKTR